MIYEQEEDHKRHLLVLIAGFALLLVLLVISGLVAVDSMRFIESDATRFVAERDATARLIEELQSEEGNLSSVFYSVATGRMVPDRTVLLQRLDALESAIRRTTEAGALSNDSVLWRKVRRAAEAFIAEGRATINSQRAPTGEFFQRHQNLLAALADLAASSFGSGGALMAETERLSSRVRYSVALLGMALVVALAGALLTVYLVNRMFRKLSWQASELAHLSSHTMADHEKTARRLSSEMHDHFGQTLSAIEANLVVMQRSRTFHPGRLEDCLGLVKDAVENVREVSHLLRPSILDDFGLNAALRWLADTFAERNLIEVKADCSFVGRVDGETETQLFRIAQEALTNVARHANASEVRLELREEGNRLRLSISDNGKGMVTSSRDGGMGLVGMRARARAVGGTLRVDSWPGKGVSIAIEVPLRHSVYAAQDSHSASR